VCLLCLKNRIGQLYTTPWKSIIIKGIDTADRNLWGGILSRYKLNIRHAANELNWQVEDICDEGLELKKQLVQEFEEADLRTYQLCFAIKTQSKTGLSGSVIIKKVNDNWFDLLHTRDFNPNSKEYVTYLEQVRPGELSKYLITLCNEFYDLQSNSILVSPSVAHDPLETGSQHERKAVYQCKQCLTRYDKVYGDCVNEIEAGFNFDEITDYKCPVCEAPKGEFSLIEVNGNDKQSLTH
jgi:rubredoxin